MLFGLGRPWNSEIGANSTRNLGLCLVGLWNRILESLIKVGCPSRFKSFLQVESPCSCGHFKMCLTYVGPLVPEL